MNKEWISFMNKEGLSYLFPTCDSLFLSFPMSLIWWPKCPIQQCTSLSQSSWHNWSRYKSHYSVYTHVLTTGWPAGALDEFPWVSQVFQIVFNPLPPKNIRWKEEEEDQKFFVFHTKNHHYTQILCTYKNSILQMIRTVLVIRIITYKYSN